MRHILLSLGAWGTIVFSVLTGIGLAHQAWKNWRAREVRAVSVPNMLFTAALFAVMALYGYAIDDGIVTVSGLIRLPCSALVLWSIWRFGTVTPFDRRVAIVLGTSILALLASPRGWWDAYFLTYSAVSILTAFLQPAKIVRAGHRGTVSLVMLVMFMLSSLFWFMYGCATSNVLIAGPTFVTVLVFKATVALWIGADPDPHARLAT